MSTQPDTEVQERVVIGMAGLSGRDDFSLYLMFIFNNHGVEGVVRQSAGLYLKSCLGERYCSFPGEVCFCFSFSFSFLNGTNPSLSPSSCR